VADESPIGLTSDIPLSSPSEVQRVMTKEDVAACLGIRVSTVDTYARQGVIPSIQINKHRRYVAKDIDAYIDSLRR